MALITVIPLSGHTMRMLKVAGHKDVTLYELQGYGHGLVEPASAPLLRWFHDQESGRQGVAVCLLAGRPPMR